MGPLARWPWTKRKGLPFTRPRLGSVARAMLVSRRQPQWQRPYGIRQPGTPHVAPSHSLSSCIGNHLSGVGPRGSQSVAGVSFCRQFYPRALLPPPAPHPSAGSGTTRATGHSTGPCAPIEGAIIQVEPASVEQVFRAHDGRWVLIDADASSVAADLQRIDKSLRVRFAENGRPPFWAVYSETVDSQGRTSQHLVLTQQAHQTRSGTWTGLDNRIVERVRYIDSHGTGGYDYTGALERETRARPERARKEFAEKTGDGGERMAHALRRELGLGSYRGGIYVPRSIT